jgi:hypothetical protein
MAHTPGPWTIYDDGPCGSDIVLAHCDDENWDICFLSAGEPECRPACERKSNARLIAAAPELLVVVKRVIDMANCAMEYEGVDDAHTLKRAMERISKAKRECERVVAKATLEGTNGKERSLD